jgi:hypothetical protein
MKPILEHGSILAALNRRRSSRFEIYGFSDSAVMSLEFELHNAVQNTGFSRKIIRSWSLGLKQVIKELQGIDVNV